MAESFFSVVVPLYNKAAHIERTLRSVLAQHGPSFEVVVVDDGSSDGGGDVVNALGDSRIRLVRQANGGVARARNAGIEHAVGQWVAFLDADDWLHPDYLLTLQRLIRLYPDVEMVATQYKSIPESEVGGIRPWSLQGSDQQVEIIKDLPTRWLRGPSFFTSSVAVRTQVLRSMQPCFAPGESFGEDLDLWFRLAERGPIALSAAPLVARVWVPDGLSVVHQPKAEAPFLLRMEARALTPSMLHGLSRSSLRFVDESRITLARTAISAGQRSLAWALLWRARRALGVRRWWVTALMAGVVPGTLVHRWQTWRKRRKMLLA